MIGLRASLERARLMARRTAYDGRNRTVRSATIAGSSVLSGRRSTATRLRTAVSASVSGANSREPSMSNPIFLSDPRPVSTKPSHTRNAGWVAVQSAMLVR